MKLHLFSAVSAIALASLSMPAAAQHQHMPGMTMPAKPKPAVKKKPAPAKKKIVKRPAVRKAPAKPATRRKAPVRESAASKPPATAAETPVYDSTMDHGPAAPTAPTPPPPAVSPATPPVDHSQMDHSQMGHQPAAEPMAEGEHGGHSAMTGAMGPYPVARESSGTAWQPDASHHSGLMGQTGDWTLMGHGVLNLIYDHQGGRRGDDKAFASGMLMGMARRPIGDGTLQFKAMISPDPLMGKSGYPLLLASGETANGRDRLIDRQHPHDFFMELSASASRNIGARSSLFVYAGLPGAPAFGPPAFMHREAILDSPEAPISHHWLDSTHISFGVLTGGIVLDKVKLEVSRFNGREPDQRRWNIETAPLDSTALRLSWNPNANLALQGSWGHFVDPEQLEPGVDQKRLSASLLYAREVVPGWKASGTLSWGRKIVEGHRDDAFVAEAGLKHRGWTLFGRAEMTENRELLDLGHDGEEGEEDGHEARAYRVGKASLGVLRDFRIAPHVTLGAGGLVSLNFIPRGLAAEYGGRNPTGAMAFVRLKLD